MTFFIWFHILDLKDICFLMKQLFRGKIQDFTAILKKWPQKVQKMTFFSNVQKNWFGLSKCILCSLGQRNTSKLMKNNRKVVSKDQKMKYRRYFWPKMHQKWQNLSKMSWLTLAHGLWWVLLSKKVKTDPKNEIEVRRSSGKVIVLPKLSQKRPILALKWYIW